MVRAVEIVDRAEREARSAAAEREKAERDREAWVAERLAWARQVRADAARSWPSVGRLVAHLGLPLVGIAFLVTLAALATLMQVLSSGQFTTLEALLERVALPAAATIALICVSGWSARWTYVWWSAELSALEMFDAGVDRDVAVEALARSGGDVHRFRTTVAALLGRT